MNQQRICIPKFPLQAELQRYRIDCYQILNTQYYSCRHRPSGTQCLIHFWNNQWKLAGNANVPAYQIIERLLDKTKNNSLVPET
jgi:hypothetical protein